MTEEVSRLSLAVDSTQVTKANVELDKFATAGKAAETAASGLEKGSRGVGTAMAGIAAGAQKAGQAQAGLARGASQTADAIALQASSALKLQTAQAQLAVANARFASAQDALQRSLDRGPLQQNAMAAATARVQAAQAAQANAAARVALAQAALTTSTRTAGEAAKLTAFQATQLSQQLQDFFIQVQQGANPVAAFGQQFSQLTSIFGSSGGALRALAGAVLTPVAGFATLAIAVGGVAAAMHAGAEESLAFQRAIILTGNAAGVTEGQFNDMARTIAQSTNTTIGNARETLQALVASGRFSGEALQQAGRGVELLAKVTGQSREDIIRDFVRAADGPTKFAEATNKALNFLTAQQLAYIKSLEDQGRANDAMAVTLAALNGRTEQAATKVGTLERAWQGVKNAVSGAKDALLDLGRDRTTEERIKQIDAQLNALNTRRNTGSPAAAAARKALLEAERAALLETLQVQRRVATQAAEDAQTNQAAIAFGKLKEQTMSRQARLAKELADANALADRAGASAADRAAVLAGIRERFSGLDGDANALAKAKLQSDLNDIEQALKNRNEAVRDAQTVFNALRQAGQLDEADAFAAQRAQVALQAGFEEQAQRDKIARLQQQRFVGKDAARLAIENAQEIAGAEAEIGRIRSKAAAADEALTIQQVANARRRAAAQQQEQIATLQAFEAVKRANDLELSLFGAGDAERSRAQARAQIEEKFRADIERATNEIQSKRTAGTATSDDEREFEARLALLREFLGRSLAEWDKHNAARKAKEADATVGAREAFNNYQDAARNTAKQTENFFTGALTRLEDALVEFVTKGKLNWRGLADFILAEITRIIIKQQLASALDWAKGSSGGLASAAGSFFSGIFGGGRAQGGTVSRGSVYRINEGAGPAEILNTGGRQYLLAKESGRVEPQPAGPAPLQQVNNFHVQGDISSRTQGQIAGEVGFFTQRALVRNG